MLASKSIDAPKYMYLRTLGHCDDGEVGKGKGCMVGARSCYKVNNNRKQGHMGHDALHPVA